MLLPRRARFAFIDPPRLWSSPDLSWATIESKSCSKSFARRRRMLLRSEISAASTAHVHVGQTHQEFTYLAGLVGFRAEGKAIGCRLYVANRISMQSSLVPYHNKRCFV